MRTFSPFAGALHPFWLQTLPVPAQLPQWLRPMLPRQPCPSHLPHLFSLSLCPLVHSAIACHQASVSCVRQAAEMPTMGYAIMGQLPLTYHGAAHKTPCCAIIILPQ